MSPSKIHPTSHSIPPPADHVEPEGPSDAFAELGVGPAVASALAARGYLTPTPVQAALVDPALVGRDVMCSAQTGSGKTVAFGLVLAPGLEKSFAEAASVKGPRPVRAVVITPTRELAAQVRDELEWLLAPLRGRVVAVTGGTSVQGEARSLHAGADVVVGTPGRMLDHLRRGALDAKSVETVVLDEADEMLDMGFRDELEGILEALPAERRTLMLSATFPHGIATLAKKYMRDPARVALEPPGTANANISHVVHLVPAPKRIDALVNLLLVAPDERTLVFVRTRAEAAEIGGTLEQLGFASGSLTGEMAQRDRTRTLEAFRAGRVVALIATDVAARGIDVPEISRVVHLDLPHDGDTLTHRAGRTGRAGRKGTSALIVAPFARRRATELLRAAGVRAVFEPVPDADAIRDSAEKRFRAKLETPVKGAAGDGRREALARSLVEAAGEDTVGLVARMLAEVRWDGVCAPREVPVMRSQDPRDAYSSPRDSRGGFQDDRNAWRGPARPGSRAGDERHVTFRVNYGERHGATPSRLLAMVCRRGDVRGADVGGIDIGPQGSTFGVQPEVAASFAAAASRPDPRDPQVRIERVEGGRPGFDSARAPRRDAPQGDRGGWRERTSTPSDAPPPPPRSSWRERSSAPSDSPPPARGGFRERTGPDAPPARGAWRDRPAPADDAPRARWEPRPAPARAHTASEQTAPKPHAPRAHAAAPAAKSHAPRRDDAPRAERPRSRTHAIAATKSTTPTDGSAPARKFKKIRSA